MRGGGSRSLDYELVGLWLGCKMSELVQLSEMRTVSLVAHRALYTRCVNGTYVNIEASLVGFY